MGKKRILPICVLMGERKPKSEFLLALRLLQLLTMDWKLFGEYFPFANGNKQVAIELTICVDKVFYTYRLVSDRIGIISEELFTPKELCFQRAWNPMALSLRDQQPLLERAAKSGIKGAKVMYEWLTKRLVIMAPDARLDDFPTCHDAVSARCSSDLMVVFYELMSRYYDKTFVIDGFEQFIMPSTAEMMLDDFLSGCGKDNQSQLIMCTDTHDLVSRKRFRMDERYVFDSNGARRLS